MQKYIFRTHEKIPNERQKSDKIGVRVEEKEQNFRSELKTSTVCSNIYYICAKMYDIRANDDGI